jgi:hypothetical protein
MTVEERLDRLEKIVDKVLSRLSDETRRRKEKDWRRTIGMFDNDPIMKDILDEALRSRDEERAKFYRQFDLENGEK